MVIAFKDLFLQETFYCVNNIKINQMFGVQIIFLDGFVFFCYYYL